MASRSAPRSSRTRGQRTVPLPRHLDTGVPTLTWASHLLPSGRSSPRRAGKRRRRIIHLEPLEDRTVLSNVTVSMDALPSTLLTIKGDASNDSFSITENLDGTVTVAPISLPGM